MKDDKVDVTRKLTVTSYSALRLKGSPANWDGEKFTGATLPISLASGQVVLINKLTKMGQAFSDSAKSQTQQLQMLVNQRTEISIMISTQAEALLQKAEYQGKVEALPQPFLVTNNFAPFRTTLYQSDPALFEAIWTDIAKMRAAPDWAKIEQKLLAQ